MTLIVRDVCSIDASHSLVLVIISFSESSLLSNIDSLAGPPDIQFKRVEKKRSAGWFSAPPRPVLLYCAEILVEQVLQNC